MTSSIQSNVHNQAYGDGRALTGDEHHITSVGDEHLAEGLHVHVAGTSQRDSHGGQSDADEQSEPQVTLEGETRSENVFIHGVPFPTGTEVISALDLPITVVQVPEHNGAAPEVVVLMPENPVSEDHELGKLGYTFADGTKVEISQDLSMTVSTAVDPEDPNQKPKRFLFGGAGALPVETITFLKDSVTLHLFEPELNLALAEDPDATKTQLGHLVDVAEYFELSEDLREGLISTLLVHPNAPDDATKLLTDEAMRLVPMSKMAQASSVEEAPLTTEQQVKANFIAHLTDKRSSGELEKILKAVFGEAADIDAFMAQLDDSILTGDWSWVPEPTFMPTGTMEDGLDSGTLRGGSGAFVLGTKEIFLGEDLKSDPEFMDIVFEHEMGHLIETMLLPQGYDTKGDEGLAFSLGMRGLLFDETQPDGLSTHAHAAFNDISDAGVITHPTTGETVSVEYFRKKLKKIFKKAADKVIETVKKPVQTITKPVQTITKPVQNVVKSIATSTLISKILKVTSPIAHIVPFPGEQEGGAAGAGGVRALVAVNGELEAPASSGDITDLEMEASAERTAVMWHVLVDTLGGEIPNLTAENAFAFALGVYLGADSRISQETWQQFFDANLDVVTNSIVAPPDYAMFAQAGVDATTAERLVTDAAMLFHASQQAQIRAGAGDTSFDADAITFPNDPVRARDAFLRAVRNDLFQTGTSDYLTSRNTSPSTGLTTQNSYSQDFSVMGISSESILNGHFTEADLANHAGVKAILYTGNEVMQELIAQGLWKGPTLAELDGASLSTDPNLAVREVVYYSPADSSEPIKELMTPAQFQLLLQEHRSGEKKIGTSNTRFEFVGSDDFVSGVNSYTFSYIDAQGVEHHLSELPQPQYEQFLARHEKGLDHADGDGIVILPPRIEDNSALKVFWAEQALAQYDAHRTPIYDDSGNIISGQSAVTRLAQNFYQQYHHFEDATTTTDFHNRLGRPRSGTSIDALLNNGPIAGVPTVSDAQALAFMYDKMGVAEGSENLFGVFSNIGHITNVAQVAGHWAQREHNHPDHDGFFGGHGNKNRAETAVNAAKTAMENRGRGTGDLGNGLDTDLTSVKEDITLERFVDAAFDILAIASLGAEAAAAYGVGTLVERAGVVVTENVERIINTAAAESAERLAIVLEDLVTKDGAKLTALESARIMAAYADAPPSAIARLGFAIGQQAAIGVAQSQVLHDDGTGVSEVQPGSTDGLTLADSGGGTIQDQILATNLALDILERRRDGADTAALANYLYNGDHQAHPVVIEKALEYLPEALRTLLERFHSLEVAEEAALKALVDNYDATGLAAAIAEKGSPQEQWAAFEHAFRLAQTRFSVPSLMVDTMGQLPPDIAANILAYEQSSILNGTNPEGLGQASQSMNTSGPALATLLEVADGWFDPSHSAHAGAIVERLATDAPGVVAHMLLTIYDHYGDPGSQTVAENTTDSARLLGTLIGRSGGEALAGNVLAALDDIQDVHGHRRLPGVVGERVVGGSVVAPDLVSVAILQQLWDSTDTTDVVYVDALANITSSYIESSGFVTSQTLGDTVAATVVSQSSPSAGLLAYDQLLNHPFDALTNIFGRSNAPSEHDIVLAAHGLVFAHDAAPELVMAQLAARLGTEPDLVFSLLDHLKDLPLEAVRYAEISQQLFGDSITEGRNFFAADSTVNLSNQSEVSHVLGSLGPWGQAAFLSKINAMSQTADQATRKGYENALTGALSDMEPVVAAQAILHYEHHVIELDAGSAGQDLVIDALVALTMTNPDRAGHILEQMAGMPGGPEITGHFITRASSLGAGIGGTGQNLEAGVRLLSTLALVNPGLASQVESSADLSGQWAEQLVGTPPRGVEAVTSLWDTVLQNVEPVAWVLDGILDAVQSYAGQGYDSAMTFAALSALIALPTTAGPALALAGAWVARQVTNYGLDLVLQNLTPTIDQWVNPGLYPDANRVSRRAVGLLLGEVLRSTVSAINHQDTTFPQDALSRVGDWLNGLFLDAQDLALVAADNPIIPEYLGLAAAQWTGTDPNPYLGSISLLPDDLQGGAVAQLRPEQAADFIDQLPDDQGAQRLISLTQAGEAQESLAIYNEMDTVEQQAMVAAGYDPVRAQYQVDLEVALDRYQQLAQNNPGADILIDAFELIQQEYTALATYVPGGASNQMQPGNIPVQLNNQLMAVTTSLLGRFPAHYGDVLVLADNSGQLRFHVDLKQGQSPTNVRPLLMDHLGIADAALITTSDDTTIATILSAPNTAIVGHISQSATGVGGAPLPPNNAVALGGDAALLEQPLGQYWDALPSYMRSLLGGVNVVVVPSNEFPWENSRSNVLFLGADTDPNIINGLNGSGSLGDQTATAGSTIVINQEVLADPVALIQALLRQTAAAQLEITGQTSTAADLEIALVDLVFSVAQSDTPGGLLVRENMSEFFRNQVPGFTEEGREHYLALRAPWVDSEFGLSAPLYAPEQISDYVILDDSYGVEGQTLNAIVEQVRLGTLSRHPAHANPIVDDQLTGNGCFCRAAMLANEGARLGLNYVGSISISNPGGHFNFHVAAVFEINGQLVVGDPLYGSVPINDWVQMFNHSQLEAAEAAGVDVNLSQNTFGYTAPDRLVTQDANQGVTDTLDTVINQLSAPEQRYSPETIARVRALDALIGRRDFYQILASSARPSTDFPYGNIAIAAQEIPQAWSRTGFSAQRYLAWVAGNDHSQESLDQLLDVLLPQAVVGHGIAYWVVVNSGLLPDVLEPSERAFYNTLPDSVRGQYAAIDDLLGSRPVQSDIASRPNLQKLRNP